MLDGRMVAYFERTGHRGENEHRNYHGLIFTDVRTVGCIDPSWPATTISEFDVVSRSRSDATGWTMRASKAARARG